jgi:4a-hydroxytetrahydrobiopterin dehydratase
MPDVLTTTQLDDVVRSRLSGWQVEDDALVRSVVAGSFMEGIRLVDAVAEAAEAADHHPDIDIRWTTVRFRLSTHSEGGVTMKDVDLAVEIDRLTSA